MTAAVQTLCKFVIAFALLLAPVLPQLALAFNVHPAHGQHQLGHSEHAAHAEQHAVHDQAQVSDDGACDQQASCGGSCCAACAYHGMAAPVISTDGATLRSVQTAGRQHLHDILIVSSLSRPPKTG